MSTQQIQSSHPQYSTTQYLFYALIGFVIWISGVILVRLLGAAFFEPGSLLLLLLFGISLPTGVFLQFVMPKLIRIPIKDTLIPIVVMAGTALILDGIAIAFTDFYSADVAIKMTVGGWLLWTSGTQLVISLIIIGRTKVN